MLSEIPFFGTAKNSISLNRLKPITKRALLLFPREVTPLSRKICSYYNRRKIICQYLYFVHIYIYFPTNITIHSYFFTIPTLQAASYLLFLISFLIYSLKLHERAPINSTFSCCNASFLHPY